MTLQHKFKSNSIIYSTPQSLFNHLNNEFHFTLDVCANSDNAKCEKYFTEEIDGLKQNWIGNCWMNPPYNRNLKIWMNKAQEESQKHGSLICCLIPVRSNTLWWKKVCFNSEIRFIIGEVNFNELKRGLWLPLCCIIFGTSKPNTFSYIDYKEIRKKESGCINRK